MAMLWQIAVSILQWLLVVLGAPLAAGILRKLGARLQGRRGPAVLEPYRRLRKMLVKDVVISDTTSWIFRFTPYLVAGTALLAAFLVPVLTTAGAAASFGNMLLFIGVLLLGTFFLTLAGLDAGGSVGGVAAGRGIVAAALAEPALLVALSAVALRASSTSLSAMADSLLADPLLVLTPGYILALCAVLVVVVAENGRLPVSEPSTPLELAMGPQGILLEYSGRYLVLLEWASQVKLSVFLILVTNIFFPWGIAAGLTPAAVGIAFAALLLKLGVLAGMLALFEALAARLPAARVPSLLAGSFMLALLAVVSSIFLR